MHMVRVGIAMVAWLVCVAGMYAADVPVLNLKKCSEPPKIDGDLGDPAWKDAVMVDEFYVMGQDRKEKKNRAWVTFDDAWLYVAFEVQQGEIERLEPKYTAGHDDKVQREDCVKLSFAPGGQDRTWYHFKLNRANIQQDRRWPENGQQEIESWNIPWKSAVKSSQENWTVEVAVPLCILPPFDDLSKARLNLVISSFVPFRDLQGVAVGYPTRTDYSLAPLDKWWVGPDRFAKANGLDKCKIDKPFLPWVENAVISPYFERDDKYFYGIDLDVRDFSSTSGKLKLEIEDTSVGGKSTTIESSMEVNGDTTTTHVASVPVDSMVERAAVLRVLDAKTSYEWRRFAFAGNAMEALNLFGGYLDRNYYTTEKHANAILYVGLPESGLSKLSIVGEDSAGKELARSDKVTADNTFGIPLEKIPDGHNSIVIKLVDDKGKAMSCLDLELIKRPPNPGCEWKIDRVNRVVLNNGKPFFGIGFHAHRLSHGDVETVKKLKDAGFNFANLWDNVDAEGMREYLQLFEKVGLHIMPGLDDGVAGHKAEVDGPYEFKHTTASWCKPSRLTQMKCYLVGHGFAKVPRKERNEVFQEYVDYLLPDMLAVAGVAKKSPATCGHWIFDEPFPQFFDQGLIGRDLYEKINQADGYHPVMVNYSSEIPDVDQATIFMDILATDPYWIVGEPEHSRGTINWVSMITARTVARGEPRRLATWIVPMCPLWSATRKRCITRQEQFCQSYLAAIHGANGLMYFTLQNTQNVLPAWEAVSAVAAQFRDVLGDVCVMPAVNQDVRYFSRDKSGKDSPVEYDPCSGKLADIQVSLKRDPKGKGCILMAANSRYHQVDCEIEIKGLQDGKIGRCFSDDKYDVRESRLKDTFKAYGVRAYRLPAIAEPVEIAVTAIRPAGIPAPERTVLWRADRKNKMPNPSFEQCTVEGIPDYTFWRQNRQTQPPWDNCCVIVSDVVKFGENAVHVTDERSPGFRQFVKAPESSGGKPYVFSCWAKAEKKGRTGISLGIYGRKESVAGGGADVDTEWKRFEFPFVMPEKGCLMVANFFPLRCGGLWVDGLQLEEGEKVTEFEE